MHIHMPLSLTCSTQKWAETHSTSLPVAPQYSCSEVAMMMLVRLRTSIPVPFSARTPDTQAAAHSLFILPVLRPLPRSLLVLPTLSPPLSVLVLPALRQPPRSLLIPLALRPPLRSLPMPPPSLLVLPAPKLPPLSSEFQVLMTLRQVPLKLKRASGPISTVPHSKET
jgi:hypothetical protein